VAVMQINLKVMMDEIRQSSNSIHEQCRNLNHTMMNLAEHSEEQHDRVYQTLDSINRSSNDLGKLARDAEAVVHVAENSESMIEAIVAEYFPSVDGQTAAPEVEDGTPQGCPEAQRADAPPEGSGFLLPEGRDVESDVLDAASVAKEANTAPVKYLIPNAVILGNREVTQMSRELAVAARVEAFSLEEGASQMNQVASLIVENRGEVQGAWATSQQLEKTANELDKLVKYFE